MLYRSDRAMSAAIRGSVAERYCSDKFIEPKYWIQKEQLCNTAHRNQVCPHHLKQDCEGAKVRCGRHHRYPGIQQGRHHTRTLELGRKMSRLCELRSTTSVGWV